MLTVKNNTTQYLSFILIAAVFCTCSNKVGNEKMPVTKKSQIESEEIIELHQNQETDEEVVEEKNENIESVEIDWLADLNDPESIEFWNAVITRSRKGPLLKVSAEIVSVKHTGMDIFDFKNPSSSKFLVCSLKLNEPSKYSELSDFKVTVFENKNTNYNAWQKKKIVTFTIHERILEYYFSSLNKKMGNMKTVSSMELKNISWLD